MSELNIILYNPNNTILSSQGNQILIDFFGYSSGILVGITLVPQIIRVFKTKSTNDLSFLFLVISLFAAIFKLIYGVLINQLPIVVTAPIILIETLLIMIAKFLYDNKKNINNVKEIEMKKIDNSTKDKSLSNHKSLSKI